MVTFTSMLTCNVHLLVSCTKAYQTQSPGYEVRGHKLSNDHCLALKSVGATQCETQSRLQRTLPVLATNTISVVMFKPPSVAGSIKSACNWVVLKLILDKRAEHTGMDMLR